VLCGFTQSSEFVSVLANPLVIRSGPKALHGCRQDLLFAKSTRQLRDEDASFLTARWIAFGSPNEADETPATTSLHCRASFKIMDIEISKIRSLSGLFSCMPCSMQKHRYSGTKTRLKIKLQNIDVFDVFWKEL